MSEAREILNKVSRWMMHKEPINKEANFFYTLLCATEHIRFQEDDEILLLHFLFFSPNSIFPGENLVPLKIEHKSRLR